MSGDKAPVPTVVMEHLPFTTDAGIGARARIGLIVLASDYTVEHEFRQIITIPGVDFYGARIASDSRITPDTLRDMGERIAPTLRLILPGSPLDVVAFGCTSATMVLGEGHVFAAMRSVQPQARLTTPITAALAAFRAFGARRIGVLTPYTRDVNTVVQRYIEERDFEIPVFASFNEPLDPVVAGIDTASLKGAIRRMAAERPLDMVFVSCTSIRIATGCAEIEAELGFPVTSSNHALAWHCLRLAGIDDKLPHLGRLFTL
ncbi:MAG: aspartate/glutamate racemase family protein [Geminicoccaceae bacterium]|nr:aspartate/glutamate racemase family protein [Geminicoccaceae bacterium]